MNDLNLPFLHDDCDGESDCGDFQRSGCGDGDGHGDGQGDGHGDGCDANLIPFSAAVDHFSWNRP